MLRMFINNVASDTLRTLRQACQLTTTRNQFHAELHVTTLSGDREQQRGMLHETITNPQRMLVTVNAADELSTFDRHRSVGNGLTNWMEMSFLCNSVCENRCGRKRWWHKRATQRDVINCWGLKFCANRRKWFFVWNHPDWRVSHAGEKKCQLSN